jgi:hypothetical protein
LPDLLLTNSEAVADDHVRSMKALLRGLR